MHHHIKAMSKTSILILPKSSLIKECNTAKLVSLLTANGDCDHAVQTFASDNGVCKVMHVLAGRGDDDITVNSVDN